MALSFTWTFHQNSKKYIFHFFVDYVNFIKDRLLELLIEPPLSQIWMSHEIKIWYSQIVFMENSMALFYRVLAIWCISIGGVTPLHWVTPYPIVFSLNAEKCRSEYLRIRTLFTQCVGHIFIYWFLWLFWLISNNSNFPQSLKWA